MATLCLLDDVGVIAEQWELGDRPVAVGRGELADIIIADDTLSRRHFLIERAGAGFRLRDLKSHNGTWVDGRPAQETLLHHHDCIAAGRTLFLFNAETSPPHQPAPSRLEANSAGPV